MRRKYVRLSLDRVNLRRRAEAVLAPPHCYGTSLRTDTNVRLPPREVFVYFDTAARRTPSDVVSLARGLSNRGARRDLSLASVVIAL